jgi:ligand-binding sensor domain-containing protein
MRLLPAFIGLLLMIPAMAQFPYTRTLEIRLGQQRPQISSLVQDDKGLLWLATDLGLLRTDGERVETILRPESAEVSELHVERGDVFAVIGTMVVRCNSLRCDTIFSDDRLETMPVRSMLVSDDMVWLGTFGGGLWRIDGRNEASIVSSETGLRDDHINSLALLPDGRIVAATDQGVAIIDGLQVQRVYGEPESAPDNLVLCVSASPDGTIWCGTDRAGVFQWDPSKNSAPLVIDTALKATVKCLSVQEDLVWAASPDNGLLLYDLHYSGGRYRYSGSGSGHDVRDMMLDRDGALWWCDGSDVLYRADAAILVVPEHEGVDMRNATALCADPRGRIWFASPAGLFVHATAFTEEHTITRFDVKASERTPIVSVAATSDGVVWAGTFGAGVIAIPPEGVPQYYNSANTAIDDNVLSVRARGEEAWLATFNGAAMLTAKGRTTSRTLPFPGFTYDVLPLKDGSLLAATDGNGIVRWKESASEHDPIGPGEGTFYSLVAGANDEAWTAGPGSGICRLKGDEITCSGGGEPPFDDDVFALAYYSGKVIAFGSTGTLVHDPIAGTNMDVAARLGLQDLEAELNALATDNEGALWMATNKGILRMRPNSWHLSDHVPTSITSIRVGNVVHAPDARLQLPYDHQRIVIQFTGIHYVDPGSVRFQYRLAHRDDAILTTRDREVSYGTLPPGTYSFDVRAFTGSPAATDRWTSVTIVVDPPLWQRPWFIVLLLVAIIAIVLLLVRARDRRMQERARMEQEKVRFQLEALRSQVDPHFLFNSFNTLVDLIESRPEIAVQHVERLSQFFRNILLVRDKELISVEEELGLLENYFALEKIRFGEAIALRIDVPLSEREKQIVPLTLQLLVENSLKHNVATAKQPLRIDVRTADGEIVVDNAIQPKLSAPRSTGFGLESIRKRYLALTDRPVQLIRTVDRFMVRIPLIGSK